MLIYSINLTKYRHTYTQWKSMADSAIRQIAREREWESERGTKSGGMEEQIATRAWIRSLCAAKKWKRVLRPSVLLNARPTARCVLKANIFWQVEVRCHIRYVVNMRYAHPNAARLNCYLTCTHSHSHTIRDGQGKGVRQRESAILGRPSKVVKKNRGIGSKSWSPSRCRKCVRHKKKGAERKQNFGIRATTQLTIIAWQLTGLWRLRYHEFLKRYYKILKSDRIYSCHIPWRCSK